MIVILYNCVIIYIQTNGNIMENITTKITASTILTKALVLLFSVLLVKIVLVSGVFISLSVSSINSITNKDFLEYILQFNLTTLILIYLPVIVLMNHYGSKHIRKSLGI